MAAGEYISMSSQRGAIIGALNGRSAVRMGLRQMLVGALAAAVTYGVGHLIGARVS